MEENEKMVEQIGELKADKEELKLKLQVQTDPEELDQLKTQNGDLSSQIEELKKKVESSESEYMKLQEKLKKYINFQSRKYIWTKINVLWYPLLICFISKLFGLLLTLTP